MSTRMKRMTERLRMANQMKVGRKAGETVQLTRHRAAPGRPAKRTASEDLIRTQLALTSSKQRRIQKAITRSQKLKRERDAIEAALGGQTPISVRGLHRPTPPILPPGYRG